MLNFRTLSRATLALTTGMVGAASTMAEAASNPVTDAHVYTTYEASGTTGISWRTCGSTKETQGCYNSGIISPVDGACAILEGTAVATGDIVKQKIYILAAGTRKFPEAALQVWLKTNTFTYKKVKTTMELRKKLALPMNIAPDASCYLGANADYVFAGSSITTYAVGINKTNWALEAIGGSFPDITYVSGINGTTDGYVTISLGDSFGDYTFYTFTPTGNGDSFGGGLEFIPDSINSFPPQ